ncbi:hypothetical protein FHT32_001237 [Variovorax sp. SG517]|uniref:HNH endonuclease signature motif containing protein n=1 Tax=Variovorax sp. SG517 TaxID=2587117 RepID=UPI0018118EDB|nr:HNH endonuclease signature motif containing protein [Variovorax sp. SG517]NVM87598.1 hypothetical protein [Variovorax sp. SG517]
MTKSRNINRPKTRWTPVMLELLKQWYPNMTGEVVAGALQIPMGAVYRMAKKLGLRKSAEFLASDMAGRIQRGKQDARMIANRFQPGQVPANKGKHMPTRGRMAETQFKPGQAPHTTLPVGSYRRVRGGSRNPHLVLEQKMNELPGPNHVRWHPVHRLVWIAANGPVPEGHIVVFRKGMRTTVLEEITLDRLECISRAENARRNHPGNRSPELRKLIQLKGAITRQVNRITREHKERSAP